MAVIALAAKNGSKAAQLESLKAEIKKQESERKRAEKMASSVANMDDNTVRKRLHEISNHKR